MTSCWGPIGDEGSAYDMARRGVNAAFWAWDGRGKKTILVDTLLAMFRKKDLRDVCTPLYTSPNLRKDFASLAKLVTRAAESSGGAGRLSLGAARRSTCPSSITRCGVLRLAAAVEGSSKLPHSTRNESRRQNRSGLGRRCSTGSMGGKAAWGSI